MTSTYQSKVANIEVNGFTFTTPTTQGSGAQYLQTDGSGNTSWQYLNGNNPQGGSSKVMVHARRVKGLTNNAYSTMMIERSSVIMGSQYLSGNPNADNLWWSALTIPTGYDGIWLFNFSGWKCGQGNAGYRTTITRPGPTIVYDQRYNYTTNDCGTTEIVMLYNQCLADDVVTFQINENNGAGTTKSITDGSSPIGYGCFTATWYSTRELYQLSNYLTTSPLYYSTGTASQSGTTVTGANGANWSSQLVGAMIIYHTNNESAYIISVDSATQLTVDTSQTVASTSYTIFYNGVQFNNTGRITSNTTNLQATTNQLILGNSGNLTNINAPAPSGNIIISYPANTTTTLVGTNEVSTLSNKTLTNPTFNTTTTITNSNVNINTNTTNTTRTSPAIPITYFTGNITEIVRSELVQRTGGAASGWVVGGGGTIQTGAGNNNNGSRILVIGNNGTLTYTTPNNLSIGVYKFLYRLETEGNRGINLIEYQVDGGSFQTLRTFDHYYSLAWGSFIFEDYIVVSTNGNPLVIRARCNGKNTSSADFIVGFNTPFTIFKMG